MSNLTPGRYLATPIAWGLLEPSATSSNQQFAIEFRIEDEGYQGETITLFLTFTDAAFKYTMEKIRAAGLMGTDLTRLERNTDAPVPIVLKDDTYNGKTTLKVAFVGERKGIGKPLDESAARGFAAQMRQQMAAWDAENGVAPARAATRPEARTTAPTNGRPPAQSNMRHDEPSDSDDIPF